MVQSIAGRLPDFLGLGGMRCGSTQLQVMLSGHPEIFFAEPKELHYFDNLRGLYGGGPAAYAECFAPAAPMQRVGEVTPQYFYMDYAAERMKALIPNAPLFVILRDPNARLWSHYCYNVVSGYENLSLEDALEAEQTRIDNNYHILSHRYSYMSYSSYATHLKRLYQVFPREQIHILFFEEFIKEPLHVLIPLCRHLGVSVPTESLVSTNMRSGANKGKFVRSVKLQYVLRNTRMLEGDSLLRKGLRRICRNVLKLNSTAVKPLNHRYKEILSSTLGEKDDELRDLIGRDLPWMH